MCASMLARMYRYVYMCVAAVPKPSLLTQKL